MVRPTISHLGDYRLLERISVGGMAEIYRARRDDGTGPEVALKRILPHLARDAEFVQMFIDEARTAAQLHHPNICRVLEFGEDQGTNFLVMELIEGRDLKRVMEYYRLRGRPPPLAIALHILSKTCDALDYAHRARSADGRPLNIVHRDVTPQNILISFQGEAKLIDFGIAKAAHRLAQTQAGNIKGKLSYLAPELIDGRSATHRSDIFACGIVLHEVLTNGRLFAGDNDLITIDLVRRAEVVPPSRLNHALPRGLDAVVLRALARNPEGRYASAGELRDAIDAIAAETGNTGSTSQVVRWMSELFAHDRPRGEQARPSGSLLFPQARSGLRSLVDDLASELTPSPEPARAPPPEPTDEGIPLPHWLAAPTAIEPVERRRPQEPARSARAAPPPRPMPAHDLQPIDAEPLDGDVDREVTVPRATAIAPITPRAESARRSDETGPPSPAMLIPPRAARSDETGPPPSEMQPPPRAVLPAPPAPSVEQGSRQRRSAIVALVGAIVLLVAGGAVFTALLVWPSGSGLPEGGSAIRLEAGPGSVTRATTDSARRATSSQDAASGAPDAARPDLARPDVTRPDRPPRPVAASRPRPVPKRAIDAGAGPKPVPVPPKPAPVATADGVGFLIVASKPWSRVWVDGSDTGRNTPIPPSTPLRLSVGVHRITLQVEEQSFDFSVTIEAGATTKLVRTLPVTR